MSFGTDFVDAEKTVQVAGFGRRLVAYLIDRVIVIAITACLFFGIAALAGLITTKDDNVAAALGLAVYCLIFLANAAYYVVLWATTGQTVGKMALGIKVIGTDGSPVSWGKAIMRYLGYIVNSLVLSIGFIWAAFDEKRQGWHDKIAGTYVVPKETQFSALDHVIIVPSDSGGAAIVVVLVSIIPILILVSIVVIAILLLLGPVVGNVFSNIVINLEKTPTP